MNIYSSKDEKAKPILEKISKYAQQIDAMNIPYWIFAQNSNPIGLVAIGKEPLQLLAAPGTPLALIHLLDLESRDNAERFASEARKLAAEKDVEYALITLPSKEDEALSHFKSLRFRDLDDSYRMVCQLDNHFKTSGELEFVRVERVEMRHFVKVAKEFLKDSPDIILAKALEHFLDLPEDFLNFYYNMEKFYFAKKNKQPVGILNLNLTKGLISNVGVSSEERGKGYGRQIMLFGLEQLRSNGCKQAYLRVHVDNKAAIHLYEALGFTKADRYRTLIWRKDTKPN